MVARTQTVEDGPPRSGVAYTLHRAGTAEEFLRVEIPVRLSWNGGAGRRLVIRASQVTQEITVALEALRTER